jgi:hypothetical protein
MPEKIDSCLINLKSVQELAKCGKLWVDELDRAMRGLRSRDRDVENNTIC